MIRKRKFVLLKTINAVLLLFISGGATTYAVKTIFINEIHDDNASLNSGEPTKNAITSRRTFQ